MKRATALRREWPSAIRIPYRAHVSRQVVRTEPGDYVQVFKLAGASFECADDDVLNNWHERLNVLWRNIATANTALWVHIVRRRESPRAARAENAGFAAALVRRGTRPRHHQQPCSKSRDTSSNNMRRLTVVWSRRRDTLR
jgi:type IV secretion system protein VirB4